MLRIENDEIKKDNDYEKMRARRAFWNLSYDCYGADYARGIDGEGVEIIRKHEREDVSDHTRRVEMSVPISLVAPVLRRYNDFVFRAPAEFDEKLDEFNSDVDGLGTSSAEFMKDALLAAQKEGRSFVFVDTNADGSDKSATQAAADGDRVVWRHIAANNVVQQHWHNGQLVECAFIQYDEYRNAFVIWANNTHLQRWDVDVSSTSSGMIIKILDHGEMTAHGFPHIPVSAIMPDFGRGLSQAATPSEIQKSIARLRTMLDEEIVNTTFTETFITGESANNVKGTINAGSKYATFFPNPATSVIRLGGDPAQANSIRESIESDTKELYRASGISADAGSDAPAESGIAKAFKFNDLAAILKSLAKECEDAHRRAETITASMMRIVDYAPVKYPDEFLMPIYEQELNAAILAAQSPLPQVLKAKAVKRFAKRNTQLSKEEETELDTQLENLGSLPAVFS